MIAAADADPARRPEFRILDVKAGDAPPVEADEFEVVELLQDEMARIVIQARGGMAPMQLTLREFLEDGGWTRIEKETELNGRLHTSVTTWLLKASDFSPLK